jgi:hypothetical protein
MIGVRIYQSGTVTDVYMNLLADGRIKHRNSNDTFDGWETDALLTAVTFPENSDRNDPDSATRYFIAHGSYLRKNNKLVLNSLSKVFMVSKVADNGIEVLLQGQPTIHTDFRTAQKPKQIILSNKIVEAYYNEKDKTVTFMCRKCKKKFLFDVFA